MTFPYDDGYLLCELVYIPRFLPGTYNSFTTRYI